ncbi:Uncharacterized protein Rs2_25939 [Raphanus sativus]|nr:Uncharacterized protein Rs2_25939 [Raphanus sativus]
MVNVVSGELGRGLGANGLMRLESLIEAVGFSLALSLRLKKLLLLMKRRLGSWRVQMKTEDADCESEPFLGEANLLENGVEEMKRDVKVDAPSTYWLSLDQVLYPFDVAGGLSETEEQQIQGLDFSEFFDLEMQDDNEFFDLGFLNLQN